MHLQYIRLFLNILILLFHKQELCQQEKKTKKLRNITFFEHRIHQSYRGSFLICREKIPVKRDIMYIKYSFIMINKLC